ncbi:SDR family oxidoreductase [Candidatus Gottesmanbacteria bacterium]|nr:SDR family oxidoreductase [Candidatus Gottesmanbacteria bacterium]
MVYAPRILVNAVAPGYTLTRYWDRASDELKKESIEETLLKKMVTPEEIAETYLYLAKNDGITGQTIVVDAGYTVNV